MTGAQDDDEMTTNERIPTRGELLSWVDDRAAAIVFRVNDGCYSEAVGMVSSDPWPDLSRVPLLVLARVLDSIDEGHRADFVRNLTDSVFRERNTKRQSELRSAATPSPAAPAGEV